MSKYCNRYLDDAPGIRADCAVHLAKGNPCETCQHRNLLAEVIDLRAEVEQLKSCEESARKLAVALAYLLEDTQHIDHDCGGDADECCVILARETLAEYRQSQSAPKSGEHTCEWHRDDMHWKTQCGNFREGHHKDPEVTLVTCHCGGRIVDLEKSSAKKEGSKS